MGEGLVEMSRGGKCMGVGFCGNFGSGQLDSRHLCAGRRRGFVLWMPCRFFARDFAALRLGARLFFSRKGAETQRRVKACGWRAGFFTAKKRGSEEGGTLAAKGRALAAAG
jgi:hypothetical protein